MRKVVNDSTVAHMWANQTQEEGRTPTKNFYFEGRTIYSYGRHFPIAVISPKDQNIVYFTTRGYSNTTAKHISTTRYAASHKTIIYCESPTRAGQGLHMANLEAFNQDCKAIAQGKLRGARKPEIYLNQIARQREQFNAYCEHFKIKKSEQKKYKYILIESQEGGTKATDKEVKARLKEIKEREKRARLRSIEDIKNFRAFKTDRLSARIDRDYLRYNTETNRIETSQGIELPLKVAQTFYKHVKETINKGGCNNCDTQLMEFKVRTIQKEFIQVGCHTIYSDEIEQIANLLGWNK